MHIVSVSLNYQSLVTTPKPTLKRSSKALSAGSSQIILTTPIWVVRTKQQLDQTRGYSLFRCARDIYRHNGLQGFWRGMTASLLGLSETVIFFLIYENLKSRFIMQGLDFLMVTPYTKFPRTFNADALAIHRMIQHWDFTVTKMIRRVNQKLKP